MMQSLAPAPTSSMQSPSQDVVSEQILREQLLSQVNTSNNTRDHHEIPTSSPASPNDPHSVDHTMSGSGLMSASAGSDDGNDNDGRKGYGKRELSTSKRAAQNRAAQRAFRQRKEGYIKKLEEQVRDYNILNDNFKAVQAENFQLRDYIINLQTCLIESQGDFPQPPPNIDGLHPGNASQPVKKQAPASSTLPPPQPQHQQPSPPNPQQQQQQQQQQQSLHHPHSLSTGSGNAGELDQMRASAHLTRMSDPRRPTAESIPYSDPESSATGRIKGDGRDMTAAQQALQGRSER